MASDSLITLLIQTYAAAGDEILFPQYSFIFYDDATLARGARAVRVPERDCRVDVDALAERAGTRTRICLLANPGNPTGTYVTREELARLRRNLPRHVLLVVDAAYCEYVTRADYSNGRELVDASEDTVMLRTFSKIYGLAGLRVGWAYCPPGIAEVLNHVRSPYNVSTAAAAAGIAALGDEVFFKKSLDHNTAWLERLARELAALGLKPVPSAANFVLVEFPPGGRLSAQDAVKRLRDAGILVRPVARYGLPNHVRITIGTDDEMERLLAVLRA
jgi:histidinol-phosphate aminotransferase